MREAAPPSGVAETIRVEVGRLENGVTLAEGLLSPKLASAEHVRLARSLVDEIERVRGRASLELREDLRSLEAYARSLLAVLRRDSRTLHATVDELYDQMRHVRMMPAASIFDAFPLMVRDLCRETGKEVDWQVVGADLEVDRKVLELVKDPLIDMVRNAIDHGIEAPAVREAAGKPRRGRIVATVAPAEGGRISIEVADDGQGFALDAIRSAAVRSRLNSAEQIAALSDADVAELAFSAGVSTSPVITTISGHGRGLRSCANASSASKAASPRARHPARAPSSGSNFRPASSPITRCWCRCTAATFCCRSMRSSAFSPSRKAR